MAQRRTHRKRSDRPNQQKHNPVSYDIMLDMSRTEKFKFAAKRIFSEAGMEEKDWGSIYAQILTKAGKQNLLAAKDFIDEKVAEGRLPPTVAAELKLLLDRFKKRR